MKRNAIHILLLGAAFLTACTSSVPTDFTRTNKEAEIYPDYKGVTIPLNIAPLNFELDADAEDMVTRVSCGDDEIVTDGLKAQFDIDDWHTLLSNAKGKDLNVEVYVKHGGAWQLLKPFKISVSTDSIDPYMSYRLIAPSYVTYEELTLNERCLENFDARVMVDNLLCSNEEIGQCVNCHNYQSYNPKRMQFHARQNNGGTVIAYDGKLKRLNMKSDSTISAGVYPAWHPTLPLIAYSTNKTMQSFHTKDLNKIEVLDSESDLILYNVETDEIMNISNDSTEFEIYPFWSPDGKYLYYGSAHFEYKDTVAHAQECLARYKEIKYNIYRKAFNAQTRTFGERELVFDAASINKSATLPRISPDGKFLLLSVGEWGCFHIWHKDADLWLMNLQTGDIAPLQPVNSPTPESYHVWSSNGRWIMFSSRRDDGNFTRPFFAHVDKNGKATKPFELPQENPDYHRQLLKSYNIPEFMKGAVEFTPQEFADVLKGEATDVKFVSKQK